MKIRITGTATECAACVAALGVSGRVAVRHVSQPWAMRSEPEQVRVYLAADITDPKEDRA